MAAAAEAEDAAGRVLGCRGEALRCPEAGCSSELLRLPLRACDGGEDAGPVEKSDMVCKGRDAEVKSALEQIAAELRGVHVAGVVVSVAKYACKSVATSPSMLCYNNATHVILSTVYCYMSMTLPCLYRCKSRCLENVASDCVSAQPRMRCWDVCS